MVFFYKMMPIVRRGAAIVGRFSLSLLVDFCTNSSRVVSVFFAYY